MFQGRNGKILQTKKKKWEIDLGKNRCLDISGHITFLQEFTFQIYVN